MACVLPPDLLALVGELAGWRHVLGRVFPAWARKRHPAPKWALNGFARDLARAGDAAGLRALWASPGKSPNPTTVLMAGARHGRAEVVQFALHFVARARHPKGAVNRALYLAAWSGDTATLQALLAAGATNFSSALRFAAMFNRLAAMRLLFAQGPDAAAANEALKSAAENGHLIAVHMALAHGATAYEEAYQYAAEGDGDGTGYDAILRLLARFDLQQRTLDVAMADAAYRGYLGRLQLTVDLGGSDYNQALKSAASSGNLSVMHFLISRGATQFDRALLSAAQNGRIEVMSYLLECGAVLVNRALRCAAKWGHLDAVRRLLAHGANDFDGAIAAANSEGEYRVEELLQCAREEHEKRAAATP